MANARQDDESRIDRDDDDSDELGAAFRRMHDLHAKMALMTPEQVKEAELAAKLRSAAYAGRKRAADRSGVPVERDESQAAQMKRRYGSGE